MKRVIYERSLHFYETDAMGIVHHGTFVYLLEEARVWWLKQSGLLERLPFEKYNYPVLSLEIEYKNSLFFDDLVTVDVGVQAHRAQLHFDYILKTKRFSQAVSFGKTKHAVMDMSTRKVVRLPKLIVDALAAQ